MGAHVSLEVEGVIEALPAVGAEVPLDIIVALHVAVQHALVGEGLLADVACEEVSAGTVPQCHLWARAGCVTDTQELGLQVADGEDAPRQPPAPRRALPTQGPHLWALAPGDGVVEPEAAFGSSVSLLSGS